MQKSKILIDHKYQTKKGIGTCVALSGNGAKFELHAGGFAWLHAKEVEYELPDDEAHGKRSKPKKPKPPGPQFRILDRQILVVAKITFSPDLWTAYIGIVPGKDHDAEWMGIFKYGTALDESLARFLFPDFADLPYNDR